MTSKSRFVISDATVNSVETLTSGRGNQYWNLHFTMNVPARSGAEYPKATKMACFEGHILSGLQPGSVVDILGSVLVNKDGYVNLKMENIRAKGAVQSQNQGGQNYQQAPTQQAYGQMPQAPQQQAPQQQAPQQQAPAQQANNGFDDDIPF